MWDGYASGNIHKGAVVAGSELILSCLLFQCVKSLLALRSSTPGFLNLLVVFGFLALILDYPIRTADH